MVRLSGSNYRPHVELPLYRQNRGQRRYRKRRVTKLATLETGLEVKVPLFIKEGE